MKTPFRCGLCSSILVCLLLTSHADTRCAPADRSRIWPAPDWAPATPESQGMVASKLNKLRDYLEKRQTREALVIRRGRIVAEWYWRGATRDTPLHVFSVTKSMTSSAMGLLVGDGMLKLDQSASDFIPAWKDDGRTAITIRHLVSMTSGTRNEEIGYSFTQTQLAQSLKQPLGSTPGTKWEYNNIARNALGEIVAKASGFDLGDFLQKRLYAPHGVKQPCESEIV